MNDPSPASADDVKLARSIELPALSWLTATSVGSGCASACGATLDLAAGAGGLATRAPRMPSSVREPLRASAEQTAARALRRAASRSLRGVARPAQGMDCGCAAGATAGSSRGGNAGTQDGGSGSPSAGAVRPGQAQSPRLSSHSWVRDVFIAPDTQQIQRKGLGKRQPLHEPAQADTSSKPLAGPQAVAQQSISPTGP
jgi:hypothetical protein